MLIFHAKFFYLDTIHFIVASGITQIKIIKIMNQRSTQNADHFREHFQRPLHSTLYSNFLIQVVPQSLLSYESDTDARLPTPSPPSGINENGRV